RLLSFALLLLISASPALSAPTVPSTTLEEVTDVSVKESEIHTVTVPTEEETEIAAEMVNSTTEPKTEAVPETVTVPEPVETATVVEETVPEQETQPDVIETKAEEVTVNTAPETTIATIKEISEVTEIVATSEAGQVTEPTVPSLQKKTDEIDVAEPETKPVEEVLDNAQKTTDEVILATKAEDTVEHTTTESVSTEHAKTIEDAVPTDQTIAPNVTVPNVSVAVPEESTTVTDESATVPEASVVESDESVTVPEQSTTVPVETATVSEKSVIVTKVDDKKERLAKIERELTMAMKELAKLNTPVVGADHGVNEISGTVKMCTCEEADACRKESTDQMGLCMNTCTKHIQEYGSETESYIDCFKQNNASIVEAEQCFFDNNVNYCSTDEEKKFIEKPKWDDLTNITYASDTDKAIKQNYLWKQHGNKYHTMQHFFHCTKHCMHKKIHTCTKAKGCSIRMPAREEFAKKMHTCIKNNDKIAQSIRNTCQCLAWRKGVKELRGACVVIGNSYYVDKA
ncbi:hypothetical protein PENTCL1PPCAC_18763, partial [Pristionchus entomophagus]